MMQYHIVNIVENMTHLIDFHGLLGVHSVIGDAQQGFLQSLQKKQSSNSRTGKSAVVDKKHFPASKSQQKRQVLGDLRVS